MPVEVMFAYQDGIRFTRDSAYGPILTGADLTMLY